MSDVNPDAFTSGPLVCSESRIVDRASRTQRFSVGSSDVPGSTSKASLPSAWRTRIRTLPPPLPWQASMRGRIGSMSASTRLGEQPSVFVMLKRHRDPDVDDVSGDEFWGVDATGACSGAGVAVTGVGADAGAALVGGGDPHAIPHTAEHKTRHAATEGCMAGFACNRRSRQAPALKRLRCWPLRSGCRREGDSLTNPCSSLAPRR